MDLDSPWEETPDGHHAPEVEWTKLTSEFTTAGYREGIIAGKEAFLQQGFDTGFANVGAPLGRELGNLRGTAAAIRSLLYTLHQGSHDLEEIGAISAALSSIRFSDIVPHDVEAEQHAREHLDVDDLPTIANTDVNPEVPPHEGHTVEDVAKLKARLAALGAKLGFPDLL